MSASANQPTHFDHFGRAIEVGDIVLSAKPGGKYVDTLYYFSVVVSKTPKLLRVHQLGAQRPDVGKADVLISLQRRYGRKAGRVIPQALLCTGINVGLTQAEMEEAIAAGGKQAQQTLSALSSQGLNTPLFI